MGKGDECVVGWWQQRRRTEAEEAPSNFERRQDWTTKALSLLPRGRHYPSQPSLVPLTRAGKGDWGVVHLCERVGKGKTGLEVDIRREGGWEGGLPKNLLPPLACPLVFESRRSGGQERTGL